MSLLIGVLPLAAILAAPCMLLLTGRRPHPGWVAAAGPAALLGPLAGLPPPRPCRGGPAGLRPRGAHAAPTRELAGRACLAEGTIYLYSTSKRALLLAS